MKKQLLKMMAALLLIGSLTGCNGKKADERKSNIDYMALVNKIYPLPEKWEEELKTVHLTNSVGDDVEVEVRAYDAYLELKADLEKEGVHVDLDSARRSIAQQQQIVDDFTEKYGEAYTAKYVAVPGHSEHHTGLALDLYLIIDGKDIYENEDMVEYPEIWETIHRKLADHGFILRYLKGKEYVTGYGYEPWHIRYIDSAETARQIMDRKITLEEYLGVVEEYELPIDYGTSELYTKEQMDDAIAQIGCTIAAWKGVKLKAIRYSGDGNSTKQTLDWLNSLEGSDYQEAIMFYSDFHVSEEGYGTLQPGMDYSGYQWWLGLDSDGEWELASYGY